MKGNPLTQGNTNDPSDTARILAPDSADRKQRRPFGGRQCLTNTVQVRLGDTPFHEPFDAGELLLVPGDQVIADTSKGPMLGVVNGFVQRQLLDRGRIRRIIRRASQADIEQHRRNREKAKEAFFHCVKRIQARNLNMKLCLAEYLLDRSRILFYFSAEHRIDFRQLVRDLARQFGARIEMRQIGVRDGAGLIGGIGHCGKQLCCCSFLKNHSSISIRHAKDQGITLNPKKVSGMCGRLMCCLVYEHEVYLKARQSAPHIHRAVETEKGAGVVSEVDLLQGTVRVVLANGASETFAFHEVRVDNDTILRPQDIKQLHAARPKRPAAVAPTVSQPEEEYLWEGNEPDTSFSELQVTSEPTTSPSSPRIREGADRETAAPRPHPRSRSGMARGQTPTEPSSRSRSGRERTGSTESPPRPAQAGAPDSQRSSRRRRRGRRGASTSQGSQPVNPPEASSDRPSPSPRPQGNRDGPSPQERGGQPSSTPQPQQTPPQAGEETSPPRRHYRPGRDRRRKPNREK
ncbi:MAG: hypothetical protein JW797_18195 [Bradymonadales bacterium]|nr:hypothetical protein [Bradymonadales bacterium]